MCTSVIVGEKATADGSFLLARSADSSALKAQHFVIHEAREWPEGSMYRTQDHKGATAFEWPQPPAACASRPCRTGRPSSTAPWASTKRAWASPAPSPSSPATTRSRSTRTTRPPGLTEDDIPDVLLSRCTTAREACALLGRIIEEAGCGEGFGVGFVDSKEVWYLETGTGHQWIAHRTPARPSTWPRATRAACANTIRNART